MPYIRVLGAYLGTTLRTTPCQATSRHSRATPGPTSDKPRRSRPPPALPKPAQGRHCFTSTRALPSPSRSNILNIMLTCARLMTQPCPLQSLLEIGWCRMQAVPNKPSTSDDSRGDALMPRACALSSHPTCALSAQLPPKRTSRSRTLTPIEQVPGRRVASAWASWRGLSPPRAALMVAAHRVEEDAESHAAPTHCFGCRGTIGLSAVYSMQPRFAFLPPLGACCKREGLHRGKRAVALRTAHRLRQRPTAGLHHRCTHIANRAIHTSLALMALAAGGRFGHG